MAARFQTDASRQHNECLSYIHLPIRQFAYFLSSKEFRIEGPHQKSSSELKFGCHFVFSEPLQRSRYRDYVTGWMFRGSNLADPGLRRRPVVAHLLGLRIRVPLKAWMFVLCVVQYRQRNKQEQ